MADLITILEEHRALLSERGYDDIGLGTLEEPGFFMKELEQTTSKHLSEAFSKKGMRSFDLKGIGFFNEEQNVIAFLFHYELDTRNNTLELKSVKAEMGEISKEFVFQRNMYELPNATKMLSILLKLEKIKNSPVVIAKPDASDDPAIIQAYKTTLAEHQQLLAAKGYTNKEHFPYSENFICKKLEARFSKRFWKPDENQDFVINTQGYFDGQSREVRFSLFYSIDQDEKKLRLSSLMTEYEEKRICYPLGEINDLPNSITVWKQLTNEIKPKIAQVIYPKEKIRVQMREQERYLGALGYYKTFFSNDSNFIERELYGALQASLNKTEAQRISITKDIHLNLSDSMQCQFQYCFDPVQVHLTLMCIKVKLGEVEQNYFPTEQTTSLTLQNIYNELKQENRLLAARSITRKPVDPNRISHRKGL